MYSAWLRVRLLYTIVRCRLCKFFIDVFPGAWRWQDCALMRSWPDWQWQYSRAIRSRGLAVARFRRGAFPGVNPWQFFHSMYPKRGLGRENRPFLAGFARHASEMSWLWQDMRAMHPKSPANRRWRIHRANILPGRGPFRCTGPRIMHGARILPSAAEQRERSQPRRRPYGRRNRARAASCRAGRRCQRSAWCCGVSSAGGKAGISEAPLASL